jgi:hypothetical protein
MGEGTGWAYLTATELLLRHCHARIPRPEWGAVVTLVSRSEHFASRADRPQGAALNDLLLSILRIGGGSKSVPLGSWHEDWDDDDQHRIQGVGGTSAAAAAEFRPSNNANVRDLFPNKFGGRTGADAKASGTAPAASAVTAPEADTADADVKPTTLHAFFSPPAGGSAAKSTPRVRGGGTLHGFFTSSKGAGSALRPVPANSRPSTVGGGLKWGYNACGHTVRKTPVRKVGGKHEGKWMVTVSGPRVTAGHKMRGGKYAKRLYSEANDAAALQAAQTFINGGGVGGGQGAAKRAKTGRRAAPREFAPTLSAEQSSVMQRALSGESLFITGAAGTGKSFLLRQIVAALRGEHNGRPAELTHKRSLAQLTQRNTPLCSREAQPAGARCVGVPDAQGRG